MQVLDSLRHDSVVRCDHEQRKIDAADSRKHVAYEALVSWHVDKSYELAAGHRKVGKTEIDRNAAGFFFGQAIRVDAGQCFHEQRFAVVDMACGCNDHWLSVPGHSLGHDMIFQ